MEHSFPEANVPGTKVPVFESVRTGRVSLAPRERGANTLIQLRLGSGLVEMFNSRSIFITLTDIDRRG